VIDVATGTVTASIATPELPVGVAVHPSGTKVYVVALRARAVAVIGTVSHTLLGTIRVGRRPVGVAFDPTGAHAYVTNSGDDTLTIVDAVTDRAIDKVSVGESPIGVDVSATGSIWVAGSGDEGMTIVGADGGASTPLGVPGTPVASGDFIGIPLGRCPTPGLACDDANPYTGDACTTGVGCSRTVITGVDAVRTGIDAVSTIVDDPASEGDPLVAQIRATLPALEAAIAGVQTGNGGAALKPVRRALAPILRTLERARRRGTLGDAGGRLLDIAREARRKLKRLAHAGA
jgi:YVTN family beta-propeller protein